MPVIMPAQERQGTYTSGTVAVLQGGTWAFALTDIPKPSQYRDPTKSITWTIERFRGGAWKRYVWAVWTGQPDGFMGRAGIQDQDPGLVVHLDAEDQVRLRIEVPSAVTFGLFGERVVS